MEQIPHQARPSTFERWVDRFHSAQGRISLFLVVAALYYLAGRFALGFLSEHEGVAVFWPASGIAAGAMVILGARYHPAIVLAVAAATIVANLQARSSPAATLVFAACNALECLIFARITQSFDPKIERLQSLQSLAVFSLAAVAAPAIAAFPAAMAIQLMGLSQAPLWRIWLTWFQSDALGIVTVAPVLLALPAFIVARPGKARLAEGAAAVIVLGLGAHYSFAAAFAGDLSPMAPSLMLLPAFLWLTARTPTLFCAIGALVVAVVIVIDALTTHGSTGKTPAQIALQLTSAQTALLTACSILLTLSAMFARVNNVAEAWKSSEQRLKHSLANDSIYAFQFDIAQGTVHREGGLAKQLGLSHFGALSEYLAALPPADRAAFERTLAGLSPAEPYLKDTYHIRDRTGSIRVIEYRSTAEFDANARFQRLSGTVHDVTERETARLEKERQEQELRRVLAAGRVFLFDHDLVRGTATRSDNAAEILGIGPDKLSMSREEFLTYVHPDDRTQLAGSGYKLQPSHPYSVGTYRFIRPDGKQVWLEVMATGTFDANDRLTKTSGLTHDVTEREEARARIVQREEQLRRALEAGRVFAFDYDNLTSRAERSENAGEILGVGIDRVRSNDNLLIEFVHPEDRDALIAHGSRKRRGEVYKRDTFRFIKPDGQVVWLVT